MNLNLRTRSMAFVLSLFLPGCSNNKVDIVEIDYLGQVPADTTARLFAPGIVSTTAMEHSSPTFSPDGTVVLWTVVPNGFSKPAYFLEMNYENGKWSIPHRPSFNDSTVDDYYPSFSTDGHTLFFSSRRKSISNTPNSDMRIWKVERNTNGWSNPVPVDAAISKGAEFAHSVTTDGSLFFSSGFFSDALNGKTGWSIYKSTSVNGKLTLPTRLPYNVNSMGYEDGPFVAPDESFLIFESDRPEGLGGTDLYISFKNQSDLWSIPVNMGPKINSAFFERFARISPDGKYLFFGSNRVDSEARGGFDIYWIDASILNELRASSRAQESIPNEIGETLLTALDLGKWNESESALADWLTQYPSDVDAIFNYATVLRKQRRYKDSERFLCSKADLLNGNVNYVLEQVLLSLALDKNEMANQLLTSLLGEKEQLWNRYYYLSSSLFDMEKFDASDELLNKAMSVNMWSFGYYKRGCSYAQMGELDRAFQNLFLSIKNGFKETNRFNNDVELASIRKDRRWKQVVTLLK